MTDRDDETDASDPEERSTLEKAQEQKQQSYSDVGYQQVEWDLLKPPGKQILPHAHTNRLKLSEMSVREDTETTEWDIRDREGRYYGSDDLGEIPDNPTLDSLDEVCDTVESETGKQRRIALAHLAAIAREHPGDTTDAVPAAVAQVGDTPPAVQGEAVGVLRRVASADPAAVEPAVSPVAELLTPDTESMLTVEALNFVAVLAGNDPEAVLDTVPRLADLLGTEGVDPKPITRSLAYIAETSPGELITVVPKLESFLEEDNSPDVGVLAALGRVAKSYPGVAKEAIPAAVSLMDADDSRVRTNATGLLTDLAEEYPGELRSAVPQATELLKDDDERLRHNLTSLLARVANEHPAVVEPATDALVARLDDSLAGTRLNACWALNYLGADRATPELEELAVNDPDEDVRKAARVAVDALED
jgi:hypothetical protein